MMGVLLVTFTKYTSEQFRPYPMVGRLIKPSAYTAPHIAFAHVLWTKPSGQGPDYCWD